jgi:shikimate kinase
MNVVLVGFMGSGKTAVGRRIAQRLGYAFLDTDQFIEQQVGCPISQLFEEKGEPFFRALENRLVEQFAKLDNHVISTGGGMLTSPGNPERMRGAGLTVFLNADPEEILKRLERDTRRPKLKEGELRETVERLLAERMPLYQASAITVDTKGKSVNRVAGEIIHFLAEYDREPKAAPEREPDEEARAETAPADEAASHPPSGEESPHRADATPDTPESAADGEPPSGEPRDPPEPPPDE